MSIWDRCVTFRCWVMLATHKLEIEKAASNSEQLTPYPPSRGRDQLPHKVVGKWLLLPCYANADAVILYVTPLFFFTNWGDIMLVLSSLNRQNAKQRVFVVVVFCTNSVGNGLKTPQGILNRLFFLLYTFTSSVKSFTTHASQQDVHYHHLPSRHERSLAMRCTWFLVWSM